jgi:hypothetical protein
MSRIITVTGRIIGWTGFPLAAGATGSAIGLSTVLDEDSRLALIVA